MSAFPTPAGMKILREVADGTFRWRTKGGSGRRSGSRFGVIDRLRDAGLVSDTIGGIGLELTAAGRATLEPKS